MPFFQKHKRWLWPTLLLFLVIPFTPSLDLKIEQFFYDHGNDPITHFIQSPLLDFIFEDLPTATFIVLGLSILAFLVSFLGKPNWRKPALVMMLTMIIGSGVIIHLALKEYWGRPRPKQIEHFGGSQSYRAVWSPQFKPIEPSKSFACGHCTLGFFFFALYLVGVRLKSKKVQFFGLFLAFGLGLAYSLTRMMQGGHFFSDTLFAMWVMWISALISDWLVYAKEDHIETAH